MKILNIFILLSILQFVNVFANPAQRISLIAVDLNEQINTDQIKKLQLPVVYKLDQVIISKANQDQKKSLKSCGIDFTLLDQDISTNTYHLAKNTILSENAQIMKKSVGKINNYLILKNIDQESIKNVTTKTHISPLDLTSTQFFFKKNYISKRASADVEPLITEVIEDINRDSVEFFINTLQAFGSRFMLAPNRFEISEWIYDQFIQFGFTHVKYDTFTAHTSINFYPVFEDTVTLQRNVVATIPGSGDPEAVFIVCGHYDSFNSTIDPFQYAPGADDDASGTAAVLEMARVFMENGYIPRRTIKFIALAAEELMYFGDGGSEHYAALSDSLGTDIRMVINHDMISHTYQTLTNSTVFVNHHYTADHFADLAVDNIKEFTQINGQLSDYYGADLGPFIQHGFTGIYFEESEFSPYYHTSSDIIDNYSMGFCTEIIKASCATLIECSTIPTSLSDFQIFDQNEGTSLSVTWESSSDYNFDHYNIYVGEEPGIYSREETTKETSFQIDQLTSGTEYFIGLSVVDSDGYESLINERQYTPFYFSLDQGILVIDETSDGDGSFAKPDDNQVDQYYETLLKQFDLSHWDIIDNEGISLRDFGEYSTIIWQADDWQSLTTLDLITNDLGRFLRAGGNFIYTGYMPCQTIEGTYEYPDTFNPGDFVYDYLKITSTNKGFGTRFYNATTDGSDYFSIMVDTSKTSDFPAQHLSNIESIYATSEGNNILFYDSNFDTSSVQGKMIGEPVGVEYLGEDYKAITLTFPLYYMQQDQAKELLEHILYEKFSEPLRLSEISDNLPEEFKLYQNYPNPFNPTTKIKYELQITNYVDLSIYNMLGQKVTTLVSAKQQPGQYEIQWEALGVTSGVYYYRLTTGSGDVRTRKLMFLK